jgi:hypothetical protein
MPIDRWSRVSEKALSFALSLSSDVRCIHVQEEDAKHKIVEDWDQLVVAPLKAAGKPIPQLVVVNSPFRYIVQPLTEYILKVAPANDAQRVCVLVPELVVRHWWENLMHNRRADLLKVILLMRGNRNIVVINIPWYLDREKNEACAVPEPKNTGPRLIS